jgi:hypothetical protein
VKGVFARRCDQSVGGGVVVDYVRAVRPQLDPVGDSGCLPPPQNLIAVDVPSDRQNDPLRQLPQRLDSDVDALLVRVIPDQQAYELVSELETLSGARSTTPALHRAEAQ